MAGDAEQIKRRKIFPQILSTKYNSVIEATNLLEENLMTCFVLLKIKNSNASSSANFSSTCFLEFVRSWDAKVEQPADKKYELYYFSDVFVRGVEIIKNFLSDQKVVPEDKEERLALKNLINVINNQEAIGRKLANFLNSTTDIRQEETLWTIELVHHLLKELAVNQSYVIDHYSKKKIEKCGCGERITGQFGDCSLGNAEVWHGRLDILLGHKQDVALTVVTDEDEDSTQSTSSSFGIKYDDSLKSNYTQILAETTVFALAQKIYNPHLENYLIPTIVISKSHVLIFMYDAEHDILLESSELVLIAGEEEQKMIPYKTILALWLTINYRYFCTGITERMKTRGFTADFFKNVAEDKKHLYLEGLTIGGCKTQGTTYPRDYVLSQSLGFPVYAVRSRPYKPCKKIASVTTS